MNGMNLTAWKEEKVVRRFLRGERQLKPTELLAVALILETTVQALMTPDLERWATKRIAMDTVHVGPLRLGASDLAVVLADPDHTHDPLGSSVPSGVAFEERGEERSPYWRDPDWDNEIRITALGMAAQHSIPIPFDVDAASTEQLETYIVDVARTISDRYSKGRSDP